jgi:hypothetical protein
MSNVDVATRIIQFVEKGHNERPRRRRPVVG